MKRIIAGLIILLVAILIHPTPASANANYPNMRWEGCSESSVPGVSSYDLEGESYVVS